MNEYNTIANVPKSLLDFGVKNFFPKVLTIDLKRGYMIRYFTRQTNHKTGEVIEIDEKMYNQLQTNSLYKTVSLEWKIVGPLDDTPGIAHVNSPTRSTTGILTANKLSIAEAEKEISGIKYQLMNLQQFWVGK